jgi:hypothetical protein
MHLARRRIMTGKDYAVIGDGTHALTQSETLIPLDLEVEEPDEGYRVVADVFSASSNGGFYQVNIGDGDVRSHLHGNESRYTMEPSELVDYLEQSSSPVLHDGELYWTTELAEEIRGYGP